MGTKTIHAAAQPIQHYNVTGDSAYVVVPIYSTWKIATQTWATATSTT
jgi:hypothetical protein